MNSLKVAVVLGTRPELIKCSPVIKELEKRNHEYVILHTNQHYDENMDLNFWKELELDTKRFIRFSEKFSLGSVINWLVEQLKGKDICLVQGDTHSVLAGAIAARLVKVKIGHIEAGIRSYDLAMDEEINRQIAARVADFHFCPTTLAKHLLKKENISEEKIYITGNTIVDTIHTHIKKDMIDIPEIQNIETKKYIFLTMHRAELVDNPILLKKMLILLNNISNKYNLQIVYPIHPRTKKRLNEFQIKIEEEINKIILLEPVNFIQTLYLENNSKFVITDSGGIQEETCILNVPCITIRDNTERQETLEINNTLLKPSEVDLYLTGVKEIVVPSPKKINPYGEKDIANKIVAILEKKLLKNRKRVKNTIRRQQ